MRGLTDVCVLAFASADGHVAVDVLWIVGMRVAGEEEQAQQAKQKGNGIAKHDCV